MYPCEHEKIFGKGKYIFAEEKKNGRGKGGKYVEKEICGKREEKQGSKRKNKFGMEKEKLARVGWTDVREAKAL